MRRFLLLSVALCAAATSACKNDSSEGSTARLTVTRSTYAAVANGYNSVLITVVGGTKAPITLTTTRGHWDSGEKTMTLNATSGEAYLWTCAAWETGCIGSAQVIARDGANVAGATSVLFTTNEICDNGIDDDQDQLTDCADPACPQSVRCNAQGFVCGADKQCSVCAGGGGTPEAHEQSCDDGFDNDCDGDIDCLDSDCADRACATSTVVGTCRSQACACEKTEQAEVSCSNGLDDDCDGKADCEDSNCLGKICNVDSGKACGGVPVSCSACPSGQTAELPTQCADGKDNDCDGKIDCDDPDCGDKSCNVFGGVCKTQSGIPVCACASGKVAETNCADGIDDDCNGKIDCADPNCGGQICGATSASICEDLECVDSSTKYAITVAADRSRLPATASAQTPVRITVKFTGATSSGTLLDVEVKSSNAGPVGQLSVAGGPPSDRVSVSTNAFGVATVNFIASGDVGVATITATPRGTSASGSGKIEMPALGQIQISSIQYRVLGVKTSGFQESSNIAIQLFDIDQKPYPAGLQVRFRHDTLGGSSLTLPAPAPDANCPKTSCVAYNTATDASGIARLTLYAGTVAGTVSVNAYADAGNQPERHFEVPTTAIIGAKASGAHFSVVCSPENIPALYKTDGYNSLVDAPFTCLAIIKDRFNNIVGRQTMVTFKSEAGAVGQPATTPSYDPSKPPTDQADLGTALEIINTLGNRYPKDVAPHQGSAHPYGSKVLSLGAPEFEYARTDAVDGVTLNPRDGLATVIASTPGEEDFFDSNGNGVYDAEPCTDLNGNGNCEVGEFTDENKPGYTAGKWDSEPFVDLPEPFVDYDDDSTRDYDEPFIDANSDGIWNPPNGRWDADATLWTQTHVVYSGGPAAALDATGNEVYTRWVSQAAAATFPQPTPPAYFDLANPNPQMFTAITCDANFNRLAASFGGIGTEYKVTFSATDEGTTDPLEIIAMDDKGLRTRTWACDANNLTVCANDCAFVSTRPTRCLMQTVVRDYQYGYGLAPSLYVQSSLPAYWHTIFGGGDVLPLILYKR